jgi:DNA-binding protein H-NS
MTALKSMSIEKLMKLKDDVEATLSQKVSEERRALEHELSKLGGYTGGKKARGGIRGKVAPKYQHPETGETWSGRGLKPRWLTAAMKSGKSLEAFAITAGKALAVDHGKRQSEWAPQETNGPNRRRRTVRRLSALLPLLALFVPAEKRDHRVI